MGQENGRHTWPKPACGYQTITGRRYGRRHAYINFHPTLSKQKARSNEGGQDWQEMEMNSVDGGKSLSPNRNFSSVLQAIFPVTSNSIHTEPEVSELDKDPREMEASSQRRMQVSEDYDAPGLFYIKEPTETCEWPSADDGEDEAHGSGILNFVNIDSYEPDSSDGDEEEEEEEEEEEGRLDPSLGLQKRLDDMISELGREFDYLSDLYLYGKPNDERDRSSERDTKEEADNEMDNCSLDVQNTEDNEVPEASCTEQAEMVVRPKVRKQAGETYSENGKSPIPERARRKTNISQSDLPTSAKVGRPRKQPVCDLQQTECDSAELVTMQEEKDHVQDYIRLGNNEDDMWEDLDCAKGDESCGDSECSEGQWSTSWTSNSPAEKEHCSSNESWETLPSLGEPELHASNSSLEDVPELNFIPEDQAPLEEGEIPWLSYHPETDSSSDEDLEPGSHFVHPGVFMLQGNNNLDDDSSASEDLDAEWRMLDDFGESFGMAQAISYVDPQLLTYMALEERLAQAMEAALAHLESLAIDVEQAHPPASEETINALPQITVQEEHYGKEQCCAICCCEYVRDEVATELPCHHVFHKICVTLWLRKSGTCPVCRHVLAPPLPDSPIPTFLVSEHEPPPSNHNAAGTR